MKKMVYLAYGSNLDVEQMRLRCPGASILGVGTLLDYQLLFKGSMTGAYLTVEPKPGSRVPVGVWTVTAKDKAALDRYEGCPHFYYRTDVDLDVKIFATGKIERLTAFVYVMQEDRRLGVPSDWYVQTCLRGYQYFGFDPAYLTDALKRSRSARKAVA